MTEVIEGPLRAPAQMLQEQTYDGHKSLHDDSEAERLGIKAGPIEGPTHFSQFEPLLAELDNGVDSTETRRALAAANGH